MCGIIGFSGKESKLFNIEKIKSLLYINSTERDSKDATGFYTEKMKVPFKQTFSARALISCGDVEKNLNPAEIFIGHVRKRSVGTNVLDNAHPYKINNIIGVHNGTLTFIYNLCRQFDLEYENEKTDSYHLFKCLAKVGTPKPLSKIEGSAAILFTDELSPKVLYVYRNADRELFYGTSEEGLYISSESCALRMINCKEITLFDSNTFYTIENGEIKSKHIIQNKENKTTVNMPGSLLSKWVKLKEDNLEYNLDKKEFYYVDSILHDAYGQCTLSLSDGLKKDMSRLTRNKLVKINRNLVDFSIDYNLDDLSKESRFVKITANVYDAAHNILLDVDEYVILTDSDGFGVNKTYTAYSITKDSKVTKICPEFVRVCTIEEESEAMDLLNHFCMDDPNLTEIKNTVKFKNILEDNDKKLADFNLELITRLQKLTTDKSLKKEKLIEELTEVLNETTQIVENYIK